MANSMKGTLNHFLGLTWAILAFLGYIQLSQFISAYLKIYLAIFGYLGPSGAISIKYQGVSRTKKQQVIAIH